MNDEIEQLRCRMMELALKRGCFTAPEVLAISQRLDVLIVREQRLRFDSTAYPKRNIFTAWQTSVTSFKNLTTDHARFMKHKTMYTIVHMGTFFSNY